MFRYRTDYISFVFFLFINYVVFGSIIGVMSYWTLKFIGWNSASTPVFVIFMVGVLIVLTINSYRVVKMFAEKRDVEDLGFR